MTNENCDKVNSENPHPELLDSGRRMQSLLYLESYLLLAECDASVSYRAAIKSPEVNHWKKAMLEKMESLAENNTWNIVNIPEGKNVIPNECVFQMKTKNYGEITRFKARLVAKRFSQRAGLKVSNFFSLM